MNKVEQIKDVTVHVDPEDDEVCSPSIHLPNRSAIEQSFINIWREEYPEIQSWVLHYLDGTLMIDLLCDANFSRWKALSKKIDTDLKEQQQMTNVRLYVQHGEISK